MIEYNKNELGKVSEKYGFVRDTFEKVLRLTEVLRYIYSDEILSKHLVLKGGTAINLALSVTKLSISSVGVNKSNVYDPVTKGYRMQTVSGTCPSCHGTGYR